MAIATINPPICLTRGPGIPRHRLHAVVPPVSLLSPGGRRPAAAAPGAGREGLFASAPRSGAYRTSRGDMEGGYLLGPYSKPQIAVGQNLTLSPLLVRP